MYGIYYYITTEFDYAKRDSRHAAYEGVVLQRFELIKVCVGTVERNCFAWKVNYSYILWLKSTYPVAAISRVVIVLLVSTTKRKTRPHTDFWSARRSKRVNPLEITLPTQFLRSSVHSLCNSVHNAFATKLLFRDCYARKFENSLVKNTEDTFAVRAVRWVTMINQTGASQQWFVNSLLVGLTNKARGYPGNVLLWLLGRLYSSNRELLYDGDHWREKDISLAKATSFPGSYLYLEVERGPWEPGYGEGKLTLLTPWACVTGSYDTRSYILGLKAWLC